MEIRTEGGFSLLEVLLAAMILGVGTLGLMGLQLATLRSRGESRAHLAAVALATSTLEQALGEERIRKAAGEGLLPEAGPPGPFGRSAPGLVHTVELLREPGALRVNVVWVQSGGRARSLVLCRPWWP